MSTAQEIQLLLQETALRKQKLNQEKQQKEQRDREQYNQLKKIMY